MPYPKLKLSKLLGGGALRGGEITGEPLNWPRLGESFYLFGKPLTPGTNVRAFNTSPLVEIYLLAEPEFGMVLQTASGSRYHLEAV